MQEVAAAEAVPVEEKVPARHVFQTHAACPVSGWFMPAGQAVQVAVKDDVAPTGPKVFAGQGVPKHTVPPAAAYVPATQVVHVAAPADVLFAGPTEPAEQALPEHVKAPDVDEKVPGAQTVHAAALLKF